MMRANLLPRERSGVSLFGHTFETDHLRRAATILIIVLSTFATTCGIQWWRAQHLRTSAANVEASLDRQNASRRSVVALAREVALLQQIDRASEESRHSGNDIAAELARIGNAVPRGVWLEAIDRASDGYLISGGCRTLDDVAQTLAAFDRLRALPTTSLVRLEQPPGDNPIRFMLRLKTNEGGRP